ncbi:MmcQ/YjbR family DNA-binding protein, partial [Streptomyces sp. NPDC060223]
MAVPKNALKKWEKVREFSLGLPGATEEFPWGESVAKVNKKVFVFLGMD